MGLIWLYARGNHFLHEKVDPRQITVTKRANILFIGIALLALLLSFVVPRFSALVYLLIFPLEYLINKL